MKKIPCVFQRDFGNRRNQNPIILDAVTPGCEWVLAGEGVATRKRDGTACLYRDGKLYKRYDAKRGKQPPSSFEPAQDPDPVTGHWPGWLEVNLRNPAPEDVWHALGYWQAGWCSLVLGDVWTYELCGPRLQTNPEKLDVYQFFKHGSEPVHLAGWNRTRDRDASSDPGIVLGSLAAAIAADAFSYLKSFLSAFEGEGLVFWRDPSDAACDKAKLTRSNFGFTWPL